MDLVIFFFLCCAVLCYDISVYALPPRLRSL